MSTLASNSDSASYLELRNNILTADSATTLGANLVLSPKEAAVNRILLTEKVAELDLAYKNPSSFLPSRHFFDAKTSINQSRVFGLIKKLPKGGCLHTHMLAAASVDFIVDEVTYRDNLYGCLLNGTLKLRFMADGDNDTHGVWKELKQFRRDTPDFDVWLRDQLTLERSNYQEIYPTIDDIWGVFKRIFNTTYEMFCFKPVFQAYIYRVLKELHLDNVFYAELRGTFMPLYELDGTVHGNKEFLETLAEVVNKFKRDHPNFLGLRYIHSVYRGVDNETMAKSIHDLLDMKRLFPALIAGLDFVGFENEAKPLMEFHCELLAARLPFYFHAGETNWFGHTDLNLVDAILMNSTRIGHAFALTKHPALLKLAMERDIAVEICPISNQVLMLNADARNHPAAHLIAIGYPVVVCNDDPGLWGAIGLSYDWYVAFMAMTSRNQGIAVLKQLAINSIVYSAMDGDEKKRAMELWKVLWEDFLDDVINKC